MNDENNAVEASRSNELLDRPPEDDISFRWMALMYPQEVHATDPYGFWTVFQQECPGVSRAEMERLLKESEAV